MDTTYKNILPIVTPFSDMGNHLRPPHKRSDTKLSVTPHFLLSDHLNLFLHHNTIPKSVTDIHLHTPTHGNTPIIATLFFSLPLTTPRNGSWWYWHHDGTPQQAMKINTQTTTAQHKNMLLVTLVISESQFTILMEVCFDPIIYFSMIYATIWYFLSVNSQLIFTPLLHMD